MDMIEVSNYLADSIREGIRLWKVKNTKESIIKETTALLDKDKKTIILKLLGFDNRLGRGWELDYCNGRAGNSDMGDTLKSINKKLIDKWVSEIEFPELEDTYKKQILAHVNKASKERFKSKVNDLLIEKINKEAHKIVNEVSLNNISNIDSLIEAEKLLREIKEN